MNARCSLCAVLVSPLFLGTTIFSAAAISAPIVFSAEKATESEWNGLKKLDFKVDGRSALLIVPEKPLPGNPWIWRTEFFGAFPAADIALAKLGVYVGYINMQDMYGASPSIDIMNAYYKHVVREYKLSRKPVLEGFSRGGLFAFNWAAKNPQKVSGIYVDAPVCDFRSWPGGKGKGKGSPGDWDKLCKIYKMTPDQAMKSKEAPIDNLAPIAKAKIPILAVVGDADEIVPVEENTAIVEERYKKLGGVIKVIHKPGVGHHPHSLQDPSPIVEFVLKVTGNEKSIPVT